MPTDALNGSLCCFHCETFLVAVLSKKFRQIVTAIIAEETADLFLLTWPTARPAFSLGHRAPTSREHGDISCQTILLRVSVIPDWFAKVFEALERNLPIL